MPANTKTFVLCLLVALVEGFDLQTAGVAAPRVRAELGLDPSQMGWFFSSSTFGLLIGAALGGRLADRFGRKYVLVASIVLFGLCSILTGLAEDYPGLVAARLATGLGLGAALPNAIALVAEAGSTRGGAARVTIMTAVMPLGGAICALYAILASDLGWRSIFQIGGWAPLLLAAALVFLLPESQAFRTERGERTKQAASVPQALFGDGRARATLLLWGCFLTTFAIAYVFINWLPSLLVERGFAGPAAAGATLLYNVFGAIGGVAFGSQLAHVSRRRNIILIIFCGVAAGAAVLANVPNEYVLILAAAAALGFFINAGQFVLYGITPTYYPTAIRGTGVGAAVSVARLGAFAGPIFAGAALSAGAGSSAILLAVLPLTALALGAGAALTWRRAAPAEVAGAAGSAQ